jgi:hypothetical protein
LVSAINVVHKEQTPPSTTSAAEWFTFCTSRKARMPPDLNSTGDVIPGLTPLPPKNRSSFRELEQPLTDFSREIKVNELNALLGGLAP